MNASNGDVSPALLAAQQRLFALRKEAVIGKRLLLTETPITSYRLPINDLPAHLGWGSEVLTAILRKTSGKTTSDNHKNVTTTTGEIWGNTAVSPAAAHSSFQPNPDDTIKLFPDIALGMLRAEQAAPGRIWLLLRYLDRVGQGWLRIVSVRKTLSHKQSPLRVCGWRQLRNLLREGDGIFWTRDKTRIWLKSAANVAAALGVKRLTGKPVAVPVCVLTGSIGEVRANLYAGFHSGRLQEDRRRPIARETLTALTGVGRRTQLTYEAVTGLSVQHNYAIGEQYSAETAEKHAWHQGQATFVLQDSHGAQGKPGRSYVAWQLPNSYGGCHPHAPRGRQRRINRQLKDLVTIGAPGNSSERLQTRYYPDGKQAVKMASRHPAWDVYWWRQRTRNGRSDLWQQMR